jgi:hypothetical protein
MHDTECENPDCGLHEDEDEWQIEEVYCPNCGGPDVIGVDSVCASYEIGYWYRADSDKGGDLIPDDIHSYDYGDGEPWKKDQPYSCRDCDAWFAQPIEDPASAPFELCPMCGGTGSNYNAGEWLPCARCYVVIANEIKGRGVIERRQTKPETGQPFGAWR